MKKYKIAVVGTGYVGISNTILLSQHNEVMALDIDSKKIEMLNNKISPIKDEKISEYLKNKKLNFKATLDKYEAYKDAEFIVVATPTDYDPQTNYFDTSLVDIVIEDILEINKDATIIIKSTLPIGYTKKSNERFKTNNIIFSPEFLREGKALEDNLYPSRIIVGAKNEKAKLFADLLAGGAIKENIDILLIDSTEAESVKLFSNTYLAMRVAYFNELDSYAQVNNLNTQDIIKGVCLDPRIGDYYNNPSFGYGGYCLPKDTKQLKANYKGIPSNLISSIVDSNDTRKKFIADSIISKKPKIVGIYRLIMKSGSDNFRASATQDIIKYIKKEGIEIVVYEPTINSDTYDGYIVVNQLDKFKSMSDIIVTNRFENILNDVEDKIYTRDIFHCDS